MDNTMTRKNVYKTIDSERDYQDRMTKLNPDGKMVNNFEISHAILNIQEFINEARKKWYMDNPELRYQDTMEYLRKIAGVCVKMGEKYGMPAREKHI